MNIFGCCDVVYVVFMWNYMFGNIMMVDCYML